MGKTIFKHQLTFPLIFFYGLIVVWWIRINFFLTVSTSEIYLFGTLYSLIALIGAVQGFIVARKWGGWSSVLGKCIIFFSCGLIGLWFGQLIWSYYNIISQVEVPYPSLADIGFFSIIPFYALGSVYLGQATGVKFVHKSTLGMLSILLIPLVILSMVYFVFLRDFTLDVTAPLRSFLDFFYPFGEGITISIATIVFFLSYQILGGKMRNRILCILFALIFHFITEYTFLYTVASSIYTNGGYVDLMYATSFFFMSIGLISFNNYE